MFNISCMTSIAQYIGHKSLEDQTLSGRNGCLRPSHSVTQPLDLAFWFSRSNLIFVCLGQNVIRTTSHVNIWQIVTRTQSYVTFQFSRYVIFIQSMKRTIQSCILVDCNQDPKPCKFSIFFFKYVIFYSINEWNYSVIVFSLIFLYKKINK